MLKRILLNVLSKIQEDFGLHHKTLTHIEGGLGSQILGVISFYNKQDRFGENQAKCDLSYFNYSNRPDLWEWNLHNYKINIEDLRRHESHSRFNLIKGKKDFLTESEASQAYWQSSRSKYLSRFAFDEKDLQKFLDKVTDVSKTESYGAVHIRRGDYLQVATKVIDLDQYTQFLPTIRGALPNLLYIITDSPLTFEDKRQLENAIGMDHATVFLDGPEHDPFSLHCLMRSADLLVTSNSTFSFSAGLLGKKGQVVFSPLEFHAGKGSEKYNRTFRSVGSFTSWDLRDSRGTI